MRTKPSLGIEVKENVEDLQNLQKEYFVKFKQIQMLILLAENNTLGAHKLSQLLLSGQNNVEEWCELYKSGLSTLLGEPGRVLPQKSVERRQRPPERQHAMAIMAGSVQQKELVKRLSSETEGFRNVGEIQEWLSRDYGISVGCKTLSRYLSKNFQCRSLLLPSGKADYSLYPYRVKGTAITVTSKMMQHLGRRMRDKQNGFTCYAEIIRWLQETYNILVNHYTIFKLVTRTFQARYVLTGIPIQLDPPPVKNNAKAQNTAWSRMNKHMDMFQQFNSRPKPGSGLA